MSLSRFIEAQEPVFDQVRQELAAGQKRTHWMWFVFPQLRSLGRSPTALHFGLANEHEAQAYLADPVLGPRLLDCTALVNKVQGRSAHAIFGSPDDLKFRSCMTLFATLRDQAASQQPFTTALQLYFNGAPDPLTLSLLHAA